MDCKSVKNWLLQAERLQPKSWPNEVKTHVTTCAVCVKLANTLGKLEKAWRDQPLPAESEIAKAKFLTRLKELAVPKKAARLPWRPMRWAAVAAVLVLGVTTFSWLFFVPGETHAASDVDERLIEWNLQLVKADSNERQRLLAENEGKFREDLKKAKLSPEDREWAEKLFEDGRWFATHDDLNAEADRINELADKLLIRGEAACQNGNEKESERYASHFAKVQERGVNLLIERIAERRIPGKQEDTPERKKEGERNLNRNQLRQKQLEKMLKSVSERARPELRNALESLRKKSKGGSHGHKK